MRRFDRTDYANLALAALFLSLAVAGFAFWFATLARVSWSAP